MYQKRSICCQSHKNTTMGRFLKKRPYDFFLTMLFGMWEFPPYSQPNGGKFASDFANFSNFIETA